MTGIAEALAALTCRGRSLLERRSGGAWVAGIVVSLMGGVFSWAGGDSTIAPEPPSLSCSTGRISISLGDKGGVASDEGSCPDCSWTSICIGITGASSDGCVASLSAGCVDVVGARAPDSLAVPCF